ncbi:MAG: hypothetical protein ACRD2P_04465, partial [Terriglobia bacterium]
MTEVWPGVMDAGLNEHVTSLEQLRVIAPVKEERIAVAPTVTATEVALTSVVPVGPVEFSEKSAAAFPFKVSAGAVPVMLEVTVMAPVLLAVGVVEELVVDGAPVVMVGLNVTWKVQLAPGWSVVTQL